MGLSSALRSMRVPSSLRCAHECLGLVHIEVRACVLAIAPLLRHLRNSCHHLAQQAQALCACVSEYPTATRDCSLSPSMHPQDLLWKTTRFHLTGFPHIAGPNRYHCSSGWLGKLTARRSYVWFRSLGAPPQYTIARSTLANHYSTRSANTRASRA